MNKEELQKTYQKIVLNTNGGIDDYVIALCQIGNAIGGLDDTQQQIAELKKQLEEKEKSLEYFRDRIEKKLKEIKKDSLERYKDLESISKPTLILLLEHAIEKIDFLENGGDYNEDQRDWKDCLCDREFIFDNLVNDAIETCELFLENCGSLRNGVKKLY